MYDFSFVTSKVTPKAEPKQELRIKPKAAPKKKITKMDERKLENNNLILHEDIKQCASGMNLNTVFIGRSQYRRGSELKIITNFGFRGDSGLYEYVELLGQRIKQPKKDDNFIEITLEVKYNSNDNTAINALMTINELEDDGYLHELFCKQMIKQFGFENFVEVGFAGSPTVTVEKNFK